MALPWNERVPMLSINPHAASIEDIAKLAADLMDANATIEELREKLKFPPGELLDQWMENELKDYQMVLDHCSRTYMHFSGGRISKPNTLPEEVFSVASDLAEDDIADAVNDATESLREELAQARNAASVAH